VQPAPAPMPPGSGRFFAPGGAVPAGIRTPRDPTAREIKRAQVLAATRFDIDWGTPPTAGGSGVRWSSTRYLYEGTRATSMPKGDASDYGVAYEIITRDGHYKQAYKDTKSDQWSVRWIETLVRAPDPRYPYRVLSSHEGGLLDVRIARYLQDWARREGQAKRISG